MEDKKNKLIQTFEIGGERWVYDFENMSIGQALTCETLFRLHESIFKILPNTADDTKIIMDQMNLRQAYAAMLMKEISEGVYEPFDATLSANLDAVKQLKAIDKSKLEACKKDFFSRCHIGSNELIESLQTLMTLVKEMPEEVRSIFLSGMFSGIQEKIGINLDPSSITEALEKTGLDKDLISSQSG